MKYPEIEYYGPLYDDDRRPTSEYERYGRDITAYYEKQAETEQLVQRLVDGVDLDILTDILGRQHRTHQQCAGRSVRTILEAMAVQPHDLRNEAMVTMAKAALEATKDIGLPFI